MSFGWKQITPGFSPTKVNIAIILGRSMITDDWMTERDDNNLNANHRHASDKHFNSISSCMMFIDDILHAPEMMKSCKSHKMVRKKATKLTKLCHCNASMQNIEILCVQLTFTISNWWSICAHIIWYTFSTSTWLIENYFKMYSTQTTIPICIWCDMHLRLYLLVDLVIGHHLLDMPTMIVRYFVARTMATATAMATLTTAVVQMLNLDFVHSEIDWRQNFEMDYELASGWHFRCHFVVQVVW